MPLNVSQSPFVQRSSQWSCSVIHLCHAGVGERQTSNREQQPRVLGTSRAGWRQGCWQLPAQELLWSLLMLFDLAGIGCTLWSSWFSLWVLVPALLSPGCEELFIYSAPCLNPAACPSLQHTSRKRSGSLERKQSWAKLVRTEQKLRLMWFTKKNPSRFRVFLIASDLSVCCIRVFSLLCASQLAPSNLIYNDIYFIIYKWH